MTPIFKGIFIFYLFCEFVNLHGHEYQGWELICANEPFASNCSNNKLFLATSVRFGFLSQPSECDSRGGRGDLTDKTDFINCKCGLTPHCSFNARDTELEVSDKKGGVLLVTYQCLSAPVISTCSEVLTDDEGMLSSRSSPACNWRIEAMKGQFIEILVKQIGQYSCEANENTTRLVTIANREYPEVFNVEARLNGTLYALLPSHHVNIGFANSSLTLLSYRVIGCPELVLLDGMKFITQKVGRNVTNSTTDEPADWDIISFVNPDNRTSTDEVNEEDLLFSTNEYISMVTVQCEYTKEIWNLTCNGTYWEGELGNCTLIKKSVKEILDEIWTEYRNRLLIICLPAFGASILFLFIGLRYKLWIMAQAGSFFRNNRGDSTDEEVELIEKKIEITEIDDVSFPESQVMDLDVDDSEIKNEDQNMHDESATTYKHKAVQKILKKI